MIDQDEVMQARGQSFTRQRQPPSLLQRRATPTPNPSSSPATPLTPLAPTSLTSLNESPSSCSTALCPGARK